MREILFRGKNRHSGEWVYGYLMKGFGALNIQPEQDENTIHEIDPETVGQFTGLLDKHGKKIFEGDIIRYTDIYDHGLYLEATPEEHEGERFKDIWTVDKIIYGIRLNYPAFDLNLHNFEANGLSELSESGNFFYEVIGNIHDNPELLEAQS